MNNNIVPPEKLEKEMYTNRYFTPGIIHGGDNFLIRVHLNNNGTGQSDQFIVEYISKDLIIRADREDPSHQKKFDKIIEEGLVSFASTNGTGEFLSLFEMWPEAVKMNRCDLVAWAKRKKRKGKYRH